MRNLPGPALFVAADCGPVIALHRRYPGGGQQREVIRVPISQAGDRRRAALRAASWAVAAVAAAVTGAAMASAAYQLAGDRVDVARYPAPGRLVDADGGRRHVWVLGDGPVTVVCLPCLGGTAASWAHIARALEADARVVLYDRAGLGWSDPPPRRARLFSEMVDELRSVLHAVDAPGPYILVGQSLGGVVARLHALRHPEDTTAVVLVDSSHERMRTRIDAVDPPPWWQRSDAYERWGTALRYRSQWLGVRRLLADVGRRPASRDDILPVELVDGVVAMALSSRHRRAVEAEFAGLPAGQEAMRREARHLGDLPLTVITGGPGSNAARRRWWDPAWLELQADLVAQSTTARQVRADHTGHHVHRDDPDLVIAEVLATVERARGASGV